jgi:tetratricopeptide (TPR) repeat protein
LVTRRLARLDDDARGLVEAASVLGREFEGDLLASVVGRDLEALAPSLGEAAKRQVLEAMDDERFRFAHDKLREAAYRAIAPDRREALHRAAAIAIESKHARSTDFPGCFPDLAQHYLRAGDKAKAIDYLERAGREALAKSANKNAIAFFKEAVQQAGGQDGVSHLRRGRWHRQIADALYGLGRLEESAHHAREAATLLGWPSSTRPVRLAFSLVGQIVRQVAHRLLPGRYLRSRRHDSERLLEAARAHSTLMEGAYFRGQVLVMFHACVTMLNLAELAETSLELTTGYANALACVGVLTLHRLASSYYRQARANLERHPDPEKDSRLRMMSAVYGTGLGNWHHVDAELEIGIRLASQLRFTRRAEELYSVTSISSFLRGDLDRSMTNAETVCRSAARGDLQTLSWGTCEKAQCLLVRNRASEAWVELRNVEPLMNNKELGRTERLWVQALLARAALRHGDQELVVRAGDRALAEILAGPPISFAWIDAYGAAAEVFIARWKQARAERRSDEAPLGKAAARICGQLTPLARTLPAAEPCKWYWQGQLAWQSGQHRRAVSCWERSLASARRLEMPQDVGMALVALAEARSPGDRTRDALLEDASQIFERTGALYGLELIRTARATSATPPA